MKISKKLIITFFIGFILGAAIVVGVFGITVKKDTQIKVLENKIELQDSLIRSLNIDSVKMKK